MGQDVDPLSPVWHQWFSRKAWTFPSPPLSWSDWNIRQKSEGLVSCGLSSVYSRGKKRTMWQQRVQNLHKLHWKTTPRNKSESLVKKSFLYLMTAAVWWRPRWLSIQVCEHVFECQLGPPSLHPLTPLLYIPRSSCVLFPEQAEQKSSLRLLKLWTILKSLHEKWERLI